MNFSINKEKLQNLLIEHQKVVPVRTTLPVLSCVLIEAQNNKTTFIATDLEQTIISSLDMEIQQEGKTAIPCARFVEIVSALPSGALEVTTTKDQEIEISSTQGVYKIVGKDPLEFPETPKLQQEQQIKIKGNELLDIINNTLYAVSKDDLKP